MRRCRATIWENREQVPVEGLFHQWGQQYEDGGDAGIGNYTTAIIELDNGRVVEAMPDTVVFLALNRSLRAESGGCAGRNPS